MKYFRNLDIILQDKNFSLAHESRVVDSKTNQVINIVIYRRDELFVFITIIESPCSIYWDIALMKGNKQFNFHNYRQFNACDLDNIIQLIS
ncbi:hypothetical protein [Capybara microvirus Cap1_SP_52]|nr:hypothetical protein [Capybara microvirus Cap1_SP_52]